MAKIVYGKRDTATVVSIEKAPQSIQTLWNELNFLGVNIARVRANKERYETTTGDTFDGYHAGKVSIYNQKPKPSKPLHFVRRTPLGKDNKGMQILEVATNIDVQNTLKVVNDYEYYTTNGFFARLGITLKRMFA
jgi:hypothetical protein